MSLRPPDFDDLVGKDLEPPERDRLERVHELLISAGPPPELSSELAAPPRAATVHVLRRRRSLVAALAAALAVVALAAGYVAGDRSDDRGVWRTIPMSGVDEGRGATADLAIFDLDDAGNWPMELELRGLRPAVSGRPYELWLTRGGRLAAPCGSFVVGAEGTTVVSLNAPYRLDQFDEWVIVEKGTDTPLLTT